MARTVYLPEAAIPEVSVSNSAQFCLQNRVTEELNTVNFVALVSSGFGIILALSRLYCRELGGLVTPSPFDLPLPFMLRGPSGWGHYMHFQASWFCVLTGLFYAISELPPQLPRKNLWPAKGRLAR